MPRVLEVFQVFLKLGLTSFGGPAAHIAFFQRVFVEERQWLDARAYGELVGLCQFLPGPASSQVGFAIGLHRANLPGALAAWLGFTLPSAVIMLTFGAGLLFLDPGDYQGLIQGLKAAAVGVVAWAVWSMGRQLTPDWQRLLIAALAVITAVILSQLMAWPVLAQIGAILLGAALAPLLLAHRDPEPGAGLSIPFQKRGGFIAGGLFALGLLALPLLAWLFPSAWLSIVDAMYRAGALVFGGGHVVLPLLYAETVAQGMLEEDAFLAGYGAAQALPGPLFAFRGVRGDSGGRHWDWGFGPYRAVSTGLPAATGRAPLLAAASPQSTGPSLAERG